MRRLVALCVLPFVASATACLKPVPPASPVAREWAPVRASFGRTWDAVIDHFAAANVPIRAIERASGFIASETVPVVRQRDPRAPHPLADCGSPDFGGFIYAPTSAVYNVVVRGDSTQSAVRVTVRWVSSEGRFECSSKGVWEADAEQSIRERAERGAAR